MYGELVRYPADVDLSYDKFIVGIRQRFDSNRHNFIFSDGDRTNLPCDFDYSLKDVYVPEGSVIRRVVIHHDEDGTYLRAI